MEPAVAGVIQREKGAAVGHAIPELFARAYSEWLPASGYEYANAPDIEAYLVSEPENAAFEVWLPVVRP